MFVYGSLITKMTDDTVRGRMVSDVEDQCISVEDKRTNCSDSNTLWESGHCTMWRCPNRIEHEQRNRADRRVCNLMWLLSWRRWLLCPNRESQNAEKSRARARDFYAFWLSRTTIYWWWPTLQSWWAGSSYSADAVCKFRSQWYCSIRHEDIRIALGSQKDSIYYMEDIGERAINRVQNITNRTNIEECDALPIAEDDENIGWSTT